MSDLDLDALEAMEKATREGPRCRDLHAWEGCNCARDAAESGLREALRNAAPVLLAAARLAEAVDAHERNADAMNVPATWDRRQKALASYRALVEGRG